MPIATLFDFSQDPLKATLALVLVLVVTLVAFRGLGRILAFFGLSNRLGKAEEDAVLRGVNELDAKIHEFEKRVETLEDLAAGYYSSLMEFAGFTEGLQTLSGYRDRLIQLMVEVEILIDRGNFAKLRNVLLFLSGSPVISAESLGSIVLSDEGIDLNGWEKKTTPLIVRCCGDLEKVAGEMAKIRMIDPNRKRKPTLLRLQELRDRILFQS